MLVVTQKNSILRRFLSLHFFIIQDVLRLKKDLEYLFHTHPDNVQQRESLAMMLEAFGFTGTIDNCGWVGLNSN